jgi:membrane fusion protein (multidrug efflux system)
MPNDATPLTTLSEINEVLVYFSLSEADYISFAKEGGFQKNANSVELVMADGSVYNHKGRLTVASGNIDKTTGSMSFKAIFPNPQKLLRSGGTARVILKKDFDGVLKIPMGSVKDIQDKFFVFTLGDSSKVSMKPFEVAGKVDGQYIVKSGLKAGEKIATNNIDMLNEGVVVKAVIK